MLFVIIGRDSAQGQSLRPTIRPSHLEHLARYVEAGKLVMAGPFTDGTGSMLLVDFDTIEEAQAMMAADPFTTGGVFESCEIHPFRRTIPEQ